MDEITREMAQSLMDDLVTLGMPDWQPTLFEPGYHADVWVIASDYGPDDWTSQASRYVNSDKQCGLYVEAVNHWSIAIYPA